MNTVLSAVKGVVPVFFLSILYCSTALLIRHLSLRSIFFHGKHTPCATAHGLTVMWSGFHADRHLPPGRGRTEVNTGQPMAGKT